MIFVFSLEDEISFQTVYHYYSRMANYRNTADVPLVLVGTQGEWALCGDTKLCDFSYVSHNNNSKSKAFIQCHIWIVVWQHFYKTVWFLEKALIVIGAYCYY